MSRKGSPIQIDWSKAPHRAKYLTIDPDGTAHWWPTKPLFYTESNKWLGDTSLGFQSIAGFDMHIHERPQHNAAPDAAKE